MVSGGSVLKYSSDSVVIKSANDRRLYRVIQLSNGLVALLAAAAMCVGFGSFSDPPEAPGLAHFLEHMLFMGSTEFPDENEYDSYLSKHGGSSNAYTEAEHTCYHFEVEREFLKGALRRFSQFFISPLVKLEAMEREVLAVDSEFNQVLQNDSFRLQQLQCHTSEDGHPFNRFSWGNKKSLIDAVEKGIDLRKQILELYNHYYHGGLMKLAVIGGEPLDVLQQWVVELFSDVRQGFQGKPEFKVEGPVWRAGKLYRLEAVKDVHILELRWALPCLLQAYLKKPEDYLAHLLGHGKGSLHYFLKDKGWVTSLSAGVSDDGMERSSVAYIFSMSIYLTDCGLGKIFDIIGYVYQYLKLLRQLSPQEWIFKELQDIGNMDFRFAEEKPQDDYAAGLAEKLLVYPPEHVIYGDYVFEFWDEEMIRKILGFFTPKNMRVDVASKFFKSQDVQLEPWFESHYSEEEISSSLMELWEDPPEIDVSLHLPLKNEFIPCDFSIRADTAEINSANETLPICIFDEPLMKFWYKLDRTFKLPRANTYFRINLKGAYCEYFAGLRTWITGSVDLLVVIKENMERTLRNSNMKPLNHSSYLRLQILCKSFYDVDEKLSSLNDISLSDLRAFIPELRSQIYIEGLFHGNLLEKEVVDISNIFKSNFSVQTMPVTMRHKEQVICFPSGANFVRDVSVKNKSETNSVLELYFQIEPEAGVEAVKLKALIDLFDEIVEEPLFNQLRTKEQLGYVVECSPRVTYRVYGFCFCIQSSKYSPVYLQERTDNFINSLADLLAGLDDESFESYRSGLTAKLLEKDPSLLYETNRLWNQIVDNRYMFDLSKAEAEELRSIQKADIVNWYKTYLQEPSPKCRKLAVRVWGCNTDINEGESRTDCLQQQHIKDLAAFKMSSNCHELKTWLLQSPVAMNSKGLSRGPKMAHHG
ncbi:hypothetical protein GOBAR_AA12719 [Gossypium barbadense]|uniref:Peptidase M16 N-terminal domain-containing protein n=1 Tax=Gossypium barbadense TaxID=3634 RepID=A0A2P5XX78_GOSBA|nr:hypothetical protein GOBAR_AA12719 [Gossypium barbadense]